jgi:predicted AAA+ superfamily ATPase
LYSNFRASIGKSVPFPLYISENAAQALGQERLIELTREKDFRVISGFKEKYFELLREYCYVGGMPEVVQHFVNNNDFNAVREIQMRIIESYEKDFSNKSALAEQYVLQQLKTLKDIPVFYWANNNGTEIDFVIQLGSNVVPVEVKSSTNMRAKSLKFYRKESNPKISIRTSTADYKLTDGLYDIPLYMIEEIEALTGG